MIKWYECEICGKQHVKGSAAKCSYEDLAFKLMEVIKEITTLKKENEELKASLSEWKKAYDNIAG